MTGEKLVVKRNYSSLKFEKLCAITMALCAATKLFKHALLTYYYCFGSAFWIHRN